MVIPEREECRIRRRVGARLACATQTFVLLRATNVNPFAVNGGFAALGETFSNYNTPYLVLLAAAIYLPVPELVAIKSISVIFDLVLAVFAYKIIRRLRPESRWQPVIGTGLVLVLPTVV